MVLSRVFALLAVTLCLVACSCAFAVVTATQAQKAVTDLKTRTMQTLDKAQQRYKDAESIKQNVKLRKAKAENAASESKTAANNNKDAIVFADTANSEMQKCLNLHPGAMASAEKVVPVMEGLKTKALKLDNEAKISVEPSTDSADPYAHVTQSVEAVEVKRNDLESEIDAQQNLLNAADAALTQLSNHASKAQVANHQAHAVVAVAQMETLLSQADTDIASIKEKKEKVDATVREIDDTFDKAPGDLIPQIYGFCDNAGGDLKQITRSVGEVQNDKNTMLEHKTTADGFLVQIKKETDESKVRQHLREITTYAEKAAELLQKINEAVKSADTHVTNANYRKQQMQEVISSKISKQTDPDTTAPNPNKPEETEKDGTKVTSEDTKEQKGTNPSQPLQDTTKIMSEDTKEQKDTNPSQPLEDITTKVTSEDTKEQKGTNPVQYVEKNTKSPGIKGKVSPYDTNNDSAITASFSLLLALIVCAALN